MKRIKEKNKWISESTILVPFQMSKEQNRVITVDKVLTGNGGSTAFQKLPIKEGYVNLMIAPNVAVVEDKQNQYIENPNRYGDEKDIRFIYGNAKDKNVRADEFGRHPDLIVMVVDSFFLSIDKLKKYKIHRILIDEAHSIVQQSAYRPNLINFTNRVKELFPESEIVSMTATPTLFMNVDVVIDNPFVKGFDIHYTKDRQTTINEMIKDVKNGVEVVCFTNNRQIIAKLKCGKRSINANLITGDSLSSSLFKEQNISHNPNSKLTISSSKGFEGFDIWYQKANVYYFEDRANAYESHFPSNLVQASGRTRNGANKVTYCRLGVNTAKKEIFKNGIDSMVDEFVKDKKRSPESKLSKNIRRIPQNPQSNLVKNIYRNYIYNEQCKEGIIQVYKRQDSIDLYKESRVCDKEFPLKEYEEFYKARGIRFIDDDSTHNRNTMKTVKDLQKIKDNLFSNIEIIEQRDLYGEKHRINWKPNLYKIFKDGKGYESLKNKVKFDFEIFIAEKNYNGKYEIKPHQKRISELLSYDIDEGGNVIANGTFDALREELVELKRDKLKDKGFAFEESEIKLDEFKKYSVIYLSQILYMFSGHRAYVPNNITLNRNYNFATTIPLRMIEHVANYLGLTVTEIDIVTCNPRILYAKCGLNLPTNFYGKDKENKTKISKLLNDFMYNEVKNSSYKLQKSRAKKELSKFLHSKVVTYLMDNYFEVKRNYRGQFTSDCAFHEKNIIKELKATINHDLNDGCIERHDSIILINNEQDLDYLKTFHYSKYENIRGWFVEDKASAKDILQEIKESGFIEDWCIPDEDVA